MALNTFGWTAPGLLIHIASCRIADHHRRYSQEKQLVPELHDTAIHMNVNERIDYKTVLATLPETESKIMQLFTHGLTQREIADRLAIPLRTVQRRMGAALTKMRGVLCPED